MEQRTVGADEPQKRKNSPVGATFRIGDKDITFKVEGIWWGLLFGPATTLDSSAKGGMVRTTMEDRIPNMG